MKPTRIIKEPTTVYDQERGNTVLIIECDNGNRYMKRELADALKIPISTFHQRLAKYGWRHPELLSPRMTKRPVYNSGNCEWRKLRTKQRWYNL
jgi:hypothetical protein